MTGSRGGGSSSSSSRGWRRWWVVVKWAAWQTVGDWFEACLVLMLRMALSQVARKLAGLGKWGGMWCLRPGLLRNPLCSTGRRAEAAVPSRGMQASFWCLCSS